MKPVRAIIADESPAMRRWYASALQRVAPKISEVEECESGWELLFRLAEDRPCDLVVASKALPGVGGAQVLAMLRTTDAKVPFVLVAPFCDSSIRALIGKSTNAALVEDSLDGVRLAEAAQALMTRGAPRDARAEKVRRAVALCAAGSRHLHQTRRRALG